MCGHIHVIMHVWRPEDNCPPSTRWVPGLNSGHQGWWEVLSPTEPLFRLSPFPVVTFPDIKDKFQKRIS